MKKQIVKNSYLKKGENFIKYLIESSKLSIRRIKVIFFIAYMGIFAFNYFVKYDQSNYEKHLIVSALDVPIAAFLITAGLIVFLVMIDVVDNNSKTERLNNIINNPMIPKSIRDDAAKELLKIK